MSGVRSNCGRATNQVSASGCDVNRYLTSRRGEFGWFGNDFRWAGSTVPPIER